MRFVQCLLVSFFFLVENDQFVFIFYLAVVDV